MLMLKIFVWSELPIIFAWSLTPADAPAWVLVIGAFFLGVVNVIGAWAAARKAVAPVAAKIDELDPIVKKIETHVNSEKSRAQGEIDSYKIQVAMLKQTNEDLKQAAGLLAQAKAVSDAMTQVAVPPTTKPPTDAERVLESIDRNTAETASNTQRTDATVQKLQEKA